MFNPELAIFILVAEIAIVLVVAFFAVFYLNLVSETPAYRYLISSAMIAVLSFLLTDIICHRVLEPLLWFERDNSWRAFFWDNRSEIIAAVVAVLCFSAWQFAVRKKGGCRVSI